MLHFALLEPNIIHTTFKEKTTLTGTVYYLVVFEYQGKQVKTLLSNALVSNDRYEEFYTDDVANAEPLDAETNFGVAGTWTYRAYAQTSSTNLDPDLSDELVETGLADVTGSTVTEYSQPATVNSFM